jgi:hypothetical protein
MSLNLAAAPDGAAPDDEWSGTGLTNAGEASMFRSLQKRAIDWLVGVLGPPPPPPRRHFSKAWDERVRKRRGSC